MPVPIIISLFFTFFQKKSNSSLDLDHEVAVVQEAVSSVNLNSYHQRQFGSQGSINDLKSFDSSNGPAAVSTLQRRPMSNNNNDIKSEAGSVLSDTSRWDYKWSVCLCKLCIAILSLKTGVAEYERGNWAGGVSVFETL